MVFDFASRPPEVNSALIYSGAGAGPLSVASSAFNNLSAELSSNAASYESVISQLTGSEWQGPSSEAMAAAAQPYITWLTTTSAQLQEASVKAMSSAAAYQTAYSTSIPPAMILANRTQLAQLVAKNTLGQYTGAIAANEAQYGEFWAQDAAAMTAYASASSAAATLTPLTPPEQNTNPAAEGQQASAVSSAAGSNGSTAALNNSLSGLQGASSAAASPAADTGTSILSALNSLFGAPIVGNGIYNIGVTLAWNTAMMSATLPLLGHFLAGSPFGVTISDTTPLGAGLGFGSTLAGAGASMGSLGSIGSLGGGATLAGMGSATSVGGMSVPAAWNAAAPAEAAGVEATFAGSGWTAAADQTAGMGGGGMNGVMPGMASGGKSGMGFAGPRYGTKPKVMPTQVFV
jgi:PPE-repeat protein